MLGNGKATEWTKRPQDKARQMKAENYCSNHNKTRKISCNLKKLWIWFVQKTLQKRLISFRRTVSQNLWLEIKLEKNIDWTHGLKTTNEDLNQTNMKCLGQKWQIHLVDITQQIKLPMPAHNPAQHFQSAVHYIRGLLLELGHVIYGWPLSRKCHYRVVVSNRCFLWLD